jgi:hypothetical protein
MSVRFSTSWILRATSLVTLGLALAGCAAGGGWAAVALVALSLGALSLSGCTSSHSDRDAQVEVDAGPQGVDAGGVWESCCEDGRISTCFCPSGWACNYGWYTACGDGTCSYGPDCGDAGVPDAGAPDAGGYWEPCCVDGRIDSCFCPAGAICNYGWYTDCGNGVCVDPVSECPAAPPPME